MIRNMRHLGSAHIGVLIGVVSLIVLVSGLKVSPNVVDGQPWQHEVSPGEIKQFLKDLPGMDRAQVLAGLGVIVPRSAIDLDVVEGYLMGLTEEEFTNLKQAVSAAFDRGGFGAFVSELSRWLNGRGPRDYPPPEIPELPAGGPPDR